jgi:hypothetical protein
MAVVVLLRLVLCEEKFGFVGDVYPTKVMSCLIRLEFWDLSDTVGDSTTPNQLCSACQALILVYF